MRGDEDQQNQVRTGSALIDAACGRAPRTAARGPGLGLRLTGAARSPMRSRPARWTSLALQYLYDRAKATIENNFFRKVASYRDKEVSVRAAGHAVGAAGLGLAARRSPRCRPAHLAQSP